ncbi:hypothetical protein G6F42_024216 [Rhizopus arrhizus]|nr:hypothetical protein G6F42_024216 [Rhizopus arrhizus]
MVGEDADAEDDTTDSEDEDDMDGYERYDDEGYEEDDQQVYRERKYNTSDNDRLIRALSQPVQAWEKKWTPQSNSKTLQTFKWVKSDKVIEFEQDEESDEEPEPMETDQTPVATTTTVVEQVETVKTEGTTSEATGTSVSETIAVKDTADGQERVSTTNITSTGQPSNTSTDTAAATATTTAHIATTSTSNTASEKKLDESSIPGGPSSIISNKATIFLTMKKRTATTMAKTMMWIVSMMHPSILL